MAYLEEILKEARENKLKVRRTGWEKPPSLTMYDLLEDDWEIVEEKRELSAREVREAMERNCMNDKVIENAIKELGFKDE